MQTELQLWEVALFFGLPFLVVFVCTKLEEWWTRGSK